MRKLLLDLQLSQVIAIDYQHILSNSAQKYALDCQAHSRNHCASPFPLLLSDPSFRLFLPNAQTAQTAHT